MINDNSIHYFWCVFGIFPENHPNYQNQTEETKQHFANLNVLIQQEKALPIFKDSKFGGQRVAGVLVPCKVGNIKEYNRYWDIKGRDIYNQNVIVSAIVPKDYTLSIKPDYACLTQDLHLLFKNYNIENNNLMDKVLENFENCIVGK